MSLPPSPLPPAPPAFSPPAVSWPDPAREAAFDRWLAAVAQQHPLQPATLRPASADASFRRYLRVDAVAVGPARHFIVMDAPPDKEDCKPFVKVAALLADAGLRVPQVLAWDEPQGFMLLDDLGAQTMMEHIQATCPPPADDPAGFQPRAAPNAALQALYGEALDLLLQWQLASRPGVLPAYDQAVLQRELSLFPDWYLARHRGIDLVTLDDPAVAKRRQTLDTAFARIIEANLAAPSVYVHRDFMPRNLMMAQGGLGVLDFQDALYGPVTYDIASLMRDAFLSWEEEFVLDVTVRYWQKARKTGLLDFDGWSENFGDFYRAVEWMGLQRHLKVAGIFARLTLRDGKPKYLADAPRFITYIRTTAARYSALTPLLRLVDEVEHTPPGIGFGFRRPA